MYIPPLEPDSATPLYLRLYKNVRESLQKGHIRPGERMPSKRILASQTGLSVNTVDAAYQQLVSEGYLEARPRSGYFACDIGAAAASHKPENETALQRPEITDTAAEFLSGSPHRISGSPDITVDFSPNGVDLSALPLPKIRKSIRDVFEESGAAVFSTCGPQGADELRNALCRYLRESRGLDTSPEQILVGAGTDFILQLLVQILRAAHDIRGIAMENPVYNKAYQIFTGLQIPVDLISLDKSGMRMDELRNSGANLVYTTPSHQFPLGIIMPVNRRSDLLEWASSAPDRYIIEDDYDSEFRYAGRPIPAISSMDSRNRVIYLGTFSKSIAPSVRISYIVLPPALLMAFRKKLSFYATTVMHLDQAVLARFISSGEFERHINRMRTLYRRKRDLLLDALSPYRGVLDIGGTDAGLHLLCRVNNGMSEDRLVQNAKNAATKVYGISAYYLSEKAKADTRPAPHVPRSTVLLGYAELSEEQILKGAAALAEAWKL